MNGERPNSGSPDDVGAYLQEISRYSLIDGEREKVLGTAIQASKAAAEILALDPDQRL